MAGRDEHRPQQNRHVVAVARPQFQHPPGRMQELHAINVPGIPDIPPDPIEEDADFSPSVLGRHTVQAEDLNGFLADIKILGSLANQPADHSRGDQRAPCSLGHPADCDSRRDESVAECDHSQHTQNIFH